MEEEQALLAQGYRLIAGLDEAGRGCLAGPVVAAAVVLPLEPLTQSFSETALPAATVFAGLRDSKLMTPAQRERMYALILQEAVAVGVGSVSAALIDEGNILQATRQAMREALLNLPVQPEALLLDALTLPDVPLPQRPLIKGDARCLSIAAASVVAKVTRDRLMCRLHEEFPLYGFARHKGYATSEHLTALRLHGPSPHHRLSFAPVRAVMAGLFDSAASMKVARGESQGENGKENGKTTGEHSSAWP